MSGDSNEAEQVVYEAVVEIPKYSRNKYEYDKVLGMFRLDRPLYSPVHYPGDYGFVPNTLAGDGDPIDVLIVTDHPTFPGCVVRFRLIGALVMSDEKGEDVKLLGVVDNDPRYHEVETLDELPYHVRREIQYFFEIYKELEGKPTAVQGWRDLAYAMEELQKSEAAYSPQK